MTADNSPPSYTIMHLPPGNDEWTGALVQFERYLRTTEGQGFAAWSVERLSRASKKSDGFIALADGNLCGLLLVEVVDETAEISLPWTRPGETPVARELVLAALRVIRAAFPRLRNIRAERALLPGNTDPGGLEAAGFHCHWRLRMQLELSGWWESAPLPAGYKMAPWNIRYLDEAAEVVYHANAGTLDAKLYASFFGASAQQCRHGMLTILAGCYGPLLQQATWCLLRDHRLVGINLVIKNDPDQASILELSVHPDEQGKGLGRALMVRSLAELKHEGYERVELAVTRQNTRALALYASLGFQTIDEFPVCILP